jgi:sporulation protein YlmC with PRC-barrel domain
MLRRLKDFERWTAISRDGQELGTIGDFYCDEEHWTVRYVVVKTGNWLTGRSVLLSPMSIRGIHWESSRVDFNIVQDEIAAAPDADLAQPISRQWEADYSAYYGIPPYWMGPAVWGKWSRPDEARSEPVEFSQEPVLIEGHNLQSIRDLSGYHIHAADGEIGHVDDFFVDDVSWTVRYLIIDTSNWIGGRSVLVAPEWAESVDWTRGEIRVGITREEVMNSPQYDPAADIEGRYREELAEIYRRPIRPI